MGNFLVKHQRELEYYYVNYPYSNKHKLSAWEVYDKPKNFDYYFTDKRFTKISRGLYSNDYEKGWLYGRYAKINPIDTVNGCTITTEPEETEKEIYKAL
jgi:hypothetical protein